MKDITIDVGSVKVAERGLEGFTDLRGDRSFMVILIVVTILVALISDRDESRKVV